MRKAWIALAVPAVVSLTAATGPVAAEEVRSLQAFLTERHCDPGPVDGAWGRKTAAALDLFQLHAGTAIERPIEAADLDTLAQSAFKCSDISNISYFVPADVVRALDDVAPDTRTQLCRAAGAARTAVNTITPKEKLEGLNSKMSNANEAYGFNELQQFASAFSDVATEAYVHDNDDAKKQLIEALSRWAALDAYVETRNCVTGSCPPEWRDPLGQDPSPRKDHQTATDYVMALAMAYYTVLADHEAEAFAEHHAEINRWFGTFGDRLRNKSGSKAYFGLRMGHQWGHLLMEMAGGRMADFGRRLNKLSTTLPTQVLADGALRDRTTRGNRAMWYHHASLGELIASQEMMRANGIALDADMEANTHKAVTLFLNALDDPASIVPWAAAGHNNGEDGRNQDFTLNDFRVVDWGSSWAYAYVFRYPDHENTARLRAVVENLDVLHPKDLGIGLNFGCLYRASDPVFQSMEASGKSTFEQAITTYATDFRNVAIRLHNITDRDADYEDYKIDIGRATFGDFEKIFMRFGVLADYASSAKRPDQIRLMRMYVEASQFQPVDGVRPDFSECGELAYNAQWPSVRLHFGSERALNRCILSKLHPDDLALWYSVYSDLDGLIADVEKAGNQHAAKLLEVYDNITN